MSFVIGLAVIGTLGWLAILATTTPQVPVRHEHMRALDRLGRRDEPGRCWTCGAPTDALGNCLGVCDPNDDGDLPW